MPDPSDLLEWYDHNHRKLPWRASPGEPRMDPYKVWLSEIMLQQTTVATVGPYFQAFLARWPTVTDLAAAELDEVLHAWQGLGYYARARNLHKCAGVIAADWGGQFPETEDDLLTLPGVGPYTAAAIAAIAFDQKAVAVDGNIERVMSRLFCIETPLPDAKPEMKEKAALVAPEARCGDYTQAVMDLGATICSPKNPACGLCPWRTVCQAYAAGTPKEFPKKAPKKAKPHRYGFAFWLVRPDGAVLLRQRPAKGLLGGMMEIPSSPWQEAAISKAEAVRLAPSDALWKELEGEVLHTFTHFHLHFSVLRGTVRGNPPVDGVWIQPADFGTQALPTVMKKIVKHVFHAEKFEA